MNLFNDSGATFSDCRRYRFALWRIWDHRKPFIQFIGLNPSTADEHADDPTLRRVIGFAQSWGYGGAYMTNLFTLVSPHPEDLVGHQHDHATADAHLLHVKAICAGNVLFAWGNFKEAAARAKDVAKMYERPLCLVLNKDGSPRHPLYVPSNAIPIPYEHPLDTRAV